MTLRRSLLSTAGSLALAGIAFVGTVVLSTPRGPRFSPESFPGTLIANANANPRAAGGNPAKTFSISGSVVDLFPGAEKTLTVRFTNPLNQDLRVMSVKVVVSSTDKTGCPSTDVVAPTFRAASEAQGVLVPRNSSSTLALPISMVADTANACSGATFSLSYSGTGVLA